MLKIIVPLLLTASVSHAADSIRIYNWADYIAPDTLSNFQAATGISTHSDVYDSNEMLDAKLMAGHSGYDIVVPSNHFMGHQIKAGALQKLDKSQLPNWQNLNPMLLKALQVNDPDNQYGFPYMWGTTGIGYNVEKVKAVLGDQVPLDSWDLIFKPENLKKLSQCGVAVLDNGPEMLPIALHYLGLPHHSKNPEDYQKAEKLLMQMRSNVTYFHSSKYVSDLANGDICVAVGFSGDVLQAAAAAGDKVKIDYILPKEGAPIWFDMLAMPADAPNKPAAYALMNYLLEPKVIAPISDYLHYANGNVQADALVDPALKADPKVYPPATVIGSLYPLEAMPAKIDRLRTRIWSKVKNGA